MRPKYGQGDADLASLLEGAADEANATEDQPDWEELERLRVEARGRAKEGKLSKLVVASFVEHARDAIPADRPELLREFKAELEAMASGR